MKKLIVIAMVCALLLGGCVPWSWQKTGSVMETVAITAPTIAHQLDDVYGVLIEAKAVPDHREKATLALAALDVVAPVVKAQGAALAGDQFNWAVFVVQAAIATAKVLGVWGVS